METQKMYSEAVLEMGQYVPSEIIGMTHWLIKDKTISRALN